MKVTRHLVMYQKDPNDDLLDSIEFSQELAVQDLFAAFNVTSEDPLMYNCYLIETNEQKELLEQKTGWTLDLDSFDYQVECYGVPD